jgi:hypothetical protein
MDEKIIKGHSRIWCWLGDLGRGVDGSRGEGVEWLGGESPSAAAATSSTEKPPSIWLDGSAVEPAGDERLDGLEGTHPSPMRGLVRRVWLGRREETERRDWNEGARVRGMWLPLIRIENDWSRPFAR